MQSASITVRQSTELLLALALHEMTFKMGRRTEYPTDKYLREIASPSEFLCYLPRSYLYLHLSSTVHRIIYLLSSRE